jgi:hypothetical protein
MKVITMVQVSMTNAAAQGDDWAGRVTLTETGRVLRRMRVDGKVLAVGSALSPAFIAGLSWRAREALVSQKWIEVWPLSAEIAGS